MTYKTCRFCYNTSEQMCSKNSAINLSTTYICKRKMSNFEGHLGSLISDQYYYHLIIGLELDNYCEIGISQN